MTQVGNKGQIKETVIQFLYIYCIFTPMLWASLKNNSDTSDRQENRLQISLTVLDCLKKILLQNISGVQKPL
jgi:hypothetical protein